ncbi:hypothetical protein BS78_K001500 [Paspalum vaginatum]|uniref:Peripheral-type benzodiazepine receptor n=1 Tax=Paspalum vaginatum TaxID=158149 RepID=A0A9W8CDF8_9POAL|nr:hypothetical protein BS78_K001500 [Paspalum vaginatum]
MAATAQEGLTRRGVDAGMDDVVRDNAAAAGAASRDTKPKNKPGGAGGRSRRGLRSLAAAVSLSAALTALSFFFAASSSAPKVNASASTVAVVRAGSVAAETVLALAAWMAWAEGGLHARPGATLLPYAAQLSCALAWAPLVLRCGAARAGLACCAAMAAAAASCARGFGAVNPVAGDLAKPGVAWAVLLAVVNYKML